MQSFNFAHDSLKNFNLATQMKNITDPAITLRIDRALTISNQLSRLSKLQLKEKTKIQQIIRILQEIVDFVPHSAQIYRKEIQNTIVAYNDVLVGNKTSRASSRLKVPRKSDQNGAIYEDLIMQHVELEDMNSEIRNLKQVIKQQQQQIQKQSDTHQNNLDNLESTFRQQSFKDRRETVKISSKFDDVQNAKNELHLLQSKVEDLNQAHEEERLISKLKMKEIERSLKSKSEFIDGTKRPSGSFNLNSYNTQKINTYSDFEYPESSHIQNNISRFTDQLLQIVLNTEFPDNDTQKLRNLRVQNVKSEINIILDEIQNNLLQPIQSQLDIVKADYSNVLQQLNSKEVEIQKQYDQIQNQNLTVEKLKYENQQLHQKFMEADKELFSMKLSRTYK